MEFRFWPVIFFVAEFPPNTMKSQPSSKKFTQVRMILGLLFFVLYVGNLAVPLVHHLEVSSNCYGQTVISCGQFQFHHAGYAHDKDSCAICLNSLFNHFFELSRPLACSELLSAYRGLGFIEVHLLQERYFNFCQARAPPSLFASI